MVQEVVFGGTTAPPRGCCYSQAWLPWPCPPVCPSFLGFPVLVSGSGLNPWSNSIAQWWL
jgi:hypothetical protein